MKTNTLILLFFLCPLVMLAQETGNKGTTKSTAFIKAGVNLANISISNDGEVDESKMLPSFHVGIMGNLPITSFLYIQPGLLFTGKGAKTQDGNENGPTYFKATTNPMYIELPVNITFKAPVGSAKFFAGAGPYLAVGVAGKNKVEGSYLGLDFKAENRIDFSNDNPATSYEEGAGYGIMKRFDYGLNGTIGFEGNSALVSVNYGLGLAKLQSGADNSANNNNKHRVLSLSLGFRL